MNSHRYCGSFFVEFLILHEASYVQYNQTVFRTKGTSWIRLSFSSLSPDSISGAY